MNCPYCKKTVYGLTGLQEAQAFTKHLRRCRKNPNNIVISDGNRTAVTPKRVQGLVEALEIRAGAGQ
jgi:2-C-methyl-D-erythritol 4-phosphate cytidylyltransferase